MSERPIQVGDLVTFVRSCCVDYRDGVTIFRVAAIRPCRPAWRCSYCLAILPSEQYANDNPKYSGAPFSWLKRIPPISELEGERDASGLDERLPTREGFEEQIKKMQEALK